jgi:hypothetical protein
MAKDDKVKFVIHIDGAKFDVAKSTMTGAELKGEAHKDQAYQIFLEGHGHDADRMIGDTEAVSIENGMHFYTVPPATFGNL